MTGGGRNWRRFAIALGAIALAGLALRVIYVLVERRDVVVGGDAYFYHASANLLADGKAFISPWFYVAGYEVPAAEHPPLYLLFLSVPSALGMTSALTHMLWSCALGTATIVVVGLLGRSVVGPRVGLLAAAIAAFYPSIWAPDGALEAETLAMFLTALALLLAYRYLQHPSWPRMLALGATCGAGALTRSELILLVPLLVVPLALMRRTGDVRTRCKWMGIGMLAAMVVMAPWVGYNIARFKHPVYLSTQFEPLLASANCDRTYYGNLTGYFSIACVQETQKRLDLADAPVIDQSEQAKAYRTEAVDYITGHLSRLPVVVAARLGRIVGVYKPDQLLQIDQFFDGREEPVSRAGLFGFYALALLSIAGAVVLRRRRIVVFPLLLIVGIVLFTVTLTYANLRFRAPAEVVIAVLAAVTVDAVATATVRRRRRHRAAKVVSIATEPAVVLAPEPAVLEPSTIEQPVTTGDREGAF